MKYFQKLADNVNVLPIMHELQRHDELWDQNTLRTKHPGTAHSQVSDIWILFNRWSNQPGFEGVDIIDDKEVGPYPAWVTVPSIRPLLTALMNQVGGIRLGRVIVTKLPPGKRIDAHVDQGAPATYYERYQICLQSLPGAVFRIGNEKVNFKTGEIWWINNAVEHEVINNSEDDRIVIIVDIRVL